MKKLVDEPRLLVDSLYIKEVTFVENVTNLIKYTLSWYISPR